MFKKLNLDFHVETYDSGEKIVDYGTHFSEGKLVPKLVYHEVTGQCETLLDKCIPERFHEGFTVALMEISAMVGPHTDSEILVTINHYFQTNNEGTVFYTFKKNIVSPTVGQIRNQTTGHVFRKQELDVYGSFVAKENETWILDVTKPHSVYTPDKQTKLRKAIVLQTRVYTYDQVLEMIKEKGII